MSKTNAAAPRTSPARAAPARRVPRAYAQHAGDRQFATTLARGLELLRCFSPGEPVLGNKAIAQRLGLPPATVSRLAYTLMRMGYLAQDEAQGKYRLGSAVLSIGYPLLETYSIRQRARGAMLELSQQVRGSVSIAIRDRLSMVCIEVMRYGDRSGHPIDVGTTYSMAGTAVGRAYLAACATAEREALLNKIRVTLPQEWRRHGDRLLHNLAAYPARGCCVSVGEVYPEVQAVAVPLGRIDGGELAAINCSFQRRALNERWLLNDVAPKLLSLARRLV